MAIIILSLAEIKSVIRIWNYNGRVRPFYFLYVFFTCNRIQKTFFLFVSQIGVYGHDQCPLHVMFSRQVDAAPLLTCHIWRFYWVKWRLYSYGVLKLVVRLLKFLTQSFIELVFLEDVH